MVEEWKDVVGYEGIYEVSNRGRVRTHKNKTTYTIKHGIRHWKQRILKEKAKNNRDVRVSLWKGGKRKDYLVHRLVAEAFIPNPANKPTVNHIDGNWKPDWEDSNESKYYLSRFRNQLSVTGTIINDYLPKFGYFKNYEDCNQAIWMFGARILELYV